jgi:hypothetical protein
MLSTGLRSVLTSLSRGVNSPLPVFAYCVIERCGFGNLPKTVQRQLYSKKERESGPDWGTATPRTLRSPRPETDWNVHWCRTSLRTTARRDFSRHQVVGIHSKTKRKGRDRQYFFAAQLLTKKVKMDVKTSFFDVMSEVQKDSQDVSAGIGQF